MAAEAKPLIIIATIAIVLSLLLAFIEIPHKSKMSFRACVQLPSFFYWLILSVGNLSTTILASLAVLKSDALAPYYLFFSPFFGVFGFEVVLKNTNITMFDRGVLTIQSWIEKALDAAAGAAIEKQEDIKSRQNDKVVAKLMTFSEENINTRILNKLGGTKVTELETAAKANLANAKHYKALQLSASLTRSEARAILKSK